MENGIILLITTDWIYRNYAQSVALNGMSNIHCAFLIPIPGHSLPMSLNVWVPAASSVRSNESPRSVSVSGEKETSEGARRAEQRLEFRRIGILRRLTSVVTLSLSRHAVWQPLKLNIFNNTFVDENILEDEASWMNAMVSLCWENYNNWIVGFYAGCCLLMSSWLSILNTLNAPTWHKTDNTPHQLCLRHLLAISSE